VNWFESMRTALLALFHRERAESELDEELRAHIEQRAEDLVRDGMAPEEAKRRARIDLGGGEKYKEECREAMGTHVVDALLQDLRFCARMLRKAPSFTAVAVLTLGLGIAVNATMFSMVSTFLLRRPPGSDPRHVVVVSSVNPESSYLPDTNPVSAANYLAWRKTNDVFEEMAAADEWRTASLTEQGQSETVSSAAVSLNYFNVLGVAPQFGRPFTNREDQTGQDRVVILSHDLWERRFGSDPSMVGRTVRIDRENYHVVGVMPANFQLLGFTPQLWTPLTLTAEDETIAARKDRSLYLFARLKAGVTVEQARAEFTALARRAEEIFPDTEKGWGAAVRTLPDFLTYSFEARIPILVMMTTVGFVLMLACANVAGLLLARASVRRGELAIRISLGASRSRIAGQLLTESLVLAILGGGAGLLLAVWGVSVLRANLSFTAAISALPVKLDWNVTLFILGISVVSAVLCGLAPALKASRTDISERLGEGSRAASASRRRSRLRNVLVASEIAVALFLLAGSGLQLRRLYTIARQNLGFRVERLLTAGVTLDAANYEDDSQRRQFAQNLISRLAQIRGVDGVAVASNLPASGVSRVTLEIQGQQDLSANRRVSALHCVITPDYFRATGIPLLRGRTFTELDNADAPRVVVVNQEFVHWHLHDQEPLGKQIRLDVSDGTPEWSVIVGVVSNVKTYSAMTREDPEVYEPFTQRPASSFSLLVRTGADPTSLAPDLRAAVAQVDAELPVARVMSMTAVVERQRGGESFFIGMLGAFAVLALILAAIGVSGLVAYSVGQRTHEIGVRMALGAGRREVLRMVLGESLKLTARGVAVGLMLALPLPKLFASAFGQETPLSPSLYSVVPLTILLVSILAAYIPARRATKVDPLVALRWE
jgi:predicted permease